MKNKLHKVLGVALPILMVLALAVTLVPANTPTAEAAVGQLRFENVPLPKLGADGLYFLYSDTNLGPITVSADGSVIFATSSNGTGANITQLLKSTNGGQTWIMQTAFRTAADNKTDTTDIVSVKLSPEYASDQTVFVATTDYIYQSVDGGKNFSAMSAGWTVATENITDMDVALDDTGRASIIVGTRTGTYGGDVYVYSPATTGLSWKAQSISGATVYDVIAVSFSPKFADDEGIFAVTVSLNKIQTQASFGYTQTGEGWGTSIGPGEFTDYLGASINATITGGAITRARIGFPDDFDVDSTLSNIAFVGFSAGTEGGGLGVEDGDLYKITFSPSVSSTVDMNVRGLVSTARTGTNIWSLDVAGDAEAATVLVGTNYWSTAVSNYYWTAYISKNSGETWSSATSTSPTGGATGLGTPTSVKAEVALHPNFAINGLAYAATQGTDTSAFSRTKDSGTSWQQISLIDWANTTDNYTVTAQTISSTNTNDFMIGMRTNNTQGSIFKTTNGGGTYERIFSYANPSKPMDLYGVSRLGTDTVFVYDLSGSSQITKFYRSSNGGATFPRTITPKASDVTTFQLLGADEMWTGHSDGAVWYTSKSGRPWVKPEESDINGSVASISQSGNNVIVSTATGGTFISLDKGVTFKTLGVTPLSTTTGISLGRDAAYATNKIIYGVIKSEGLGVWRITVNEADPDSTIWEKIDATSGTRNVGSANVTPLYVFQSGGVLYTVNTKTVTAGDVYGGIWRSYNPTADLRGTAPPQFYNENNGLTAGASWTYSGYAIPTTGPVFFLKTTGAAVLYYNRLMAMTDTLASPVILTAPANNATNEGYTEATTALTKTTVIAWEAKAGATEYTYYVGTPGYLRTVAYAATTGKQATVAGLIPGQSYIWRVKVTAPFESPYSELRTFTVGSALVFDLQSPARGATDVAVIPTFAWDSYQGAIGYELMVSEDPTFTIIDWSHSSIQTVFKSEEALAYGTTYYWRVRGVTGPAPTGKAAPGGPWATGIFTTMEKPVEAQPAVIVQKEPAPPPEIKVIEVPVPGPAQVIPSYLLWIIIVVGAVLVIALIVLIVRTRRVT